MEPLAKRGPKIRENCFLAVNKPVLCNTCKHEEWALVVGTTSRMIDECYFPENNRKVGHATECEEYEPKTEANI